MSKRLEPQLARQLTQLASIGPAIRLPFIVTLAPGAQAAAVLPFAPTTVVDAIRMAAGEMTARQALDLSQHAQVERIEFDGTAEAIEALLAR